MNLKINQNNLLLNHTLTKSEVRSPQVRSQKLTHPSPLPNPPLAPPQPTPRPSQEGK
ncbi:MAG: hypothetical protein F6K48_10640 [Okeania sp. SIO3H1]|uniref:hypothetical protein n=1 Tax=Okeania sp. SIO1I7 TaxID=2607772 RepID=UPI0013C57CD0|nr:hypothetical protein [Okeania sp. SIO1I7]NEN89324.1 hypothetical protein [Okeania sp. SIO3H1]NET24451.1 hypothetical protein [Okeania sp. SIO1I7]